MLMFNLSELALSELPYKNIIWTDPNIRSLREQKTKKFRIEGKRKMEFIS